MTRPPIPDQVLRQRVVAIARRLSPAQIDVLTGALLDNGVGVLEVTLDGEGALATLATLEGSGLLLGAGTVMSVREAEEAVEAGARFVVSPHTDEAVVTWAVDNGVPVMPGAQTPTEIARAWDLGCSAVKLFPASVGGPGLLRTLRGPFRQVSFVPTGGITADNAGEYLDAGAVAVGVGSWLTGSSDRSVVVQRAAALAAIMSR